MAAANSLAATVVVLDAIHTLKPARNTNVPPSVAHTPHSATRDAHTQGKPLATPHWLTVLSRLDNITPWVSL